MPTKQKSSGLKEIVEREAEVMLGLRGDEVYGELDKEYENAVQKAEEELAKGKSELDDAVKLFNDTDVAAQEQIKDGEEKIKTLRETAEKEIAEAERKIEKGEKEYKTLLEEGEKQLADAKVQMEDELEKYREKLSEGRLELEKAEKTLKEKEAEYSAGKEKLLKGKEELDKGWEEYYSALRQIDKKLNDSIIDQIIRLLRAIIDPYDSAVDTDDELIDSNIDMIVDELIEMTDPTYYEIEELIDKLEGCKGRGTVSRCSAVLRIYDDLTSGLSRSVKKDFEKRMGIDEFRKGLNKLKEAIKTLDDYQKQYDQGKEQLEEARSQLDQGWAAFEDGERQLKEGQAEFDSKEAEARQQLEDAQNEYEQKKADGAKQLKNAKAQLSSKSAEADSTLKDLEEELKKAKEEYAVQKEDGEKKISEATQQYEDAKREADEKLSELKAQIDNMKSAAINPIVQTRDVNFPYVQTKSFIKALGGFFGVFTPLYAAIIAIVCFFTMTIIISEQTSQIGTCKAFGMHESEIMRKYLVFGVSAALIGALTGVQGAFAIEKFLINTMKSNMAFPMDNTGHDIIMIILLPAMEVFITVLAVLWSCHRYIRCSAVGLISGNEPVARYRKKAGGSISKSIYLNLIINNLFTDIGREVVSVVTIVVCVFLVGFGIDIKLAYEGALGRQMHDIWQYDITLTESGTITDEEKEAVKQALAPYDTLYLPITAGVISDGDSQILTSMICVDDKDEFARFYVLKNPKGKNTDVFDDGVLVTKEMLDKNGLSTGSTVSLVSEDLKYSDVTVKDIFMLYAGKTMIMTSDYYRERFGNDPVSNTYYIKAGETGGAATLKERLSELPGVSSVELTSNLRDRNLAVVNVYNAVVVIVILFSVMLSFMILLNLSNILVAHRMRELLTMRVNGFYDAQVIGYLTREVIMTVTLAVVTALAVGLPVTGIIIKSIETDAFMFVRQPYFFAWTASVVINVLFSAIINFIAFRKVNKVPLTDISKY
ncbi:MAG: FtsX-like permease family protein [Lachnospiraceae bacterium]|nr:FtsX-like permease family protein [Lachnospiraceae bacterium]